MACGDTATPSPTNTPAINQTVPPTLTTLPQPTATLTALPNVPVATATPTVAPFQPSQKQIGAANCCQAFGISTNGRFYYYDQPAGENKAGTYTQDLVTGQRQLLTGNFGNFSQDLAIVAIPDKASGNTTIEQVAGGTKLATLANRGSQVIFSPDKTRLAYLLRLTTQAGPEAPQSFELWTGKPDGSPPQSIWDLKEGANLSWFPDNRHLLLTARDAVNKRFGLWVVESEPTSGQGASLIVESKGLTVAGVSAGGKRVVYVVSLQGEAESGVWSALADGSQKAKFNWSGSWRWSTVNPDRLYYVPAGEKALWVYDFTGGRATRLTDPATLPLNVAGNDWALLPGDKDLVYRSAADRSLWWLQLAA